VVKCYNEEAETKVSPTLTKLKTMLNQTFVVTILTSDGVRVEVKTPHITQHQAMDYVNRIYGTDYTLMGLDIR
jgi:hypothetical protein